MRFGNGRHAAKVLFVGSDHKALNLAVEGVPRTDERGAARPLANAPVKKEIVFCEQENVIASARLAHKVEQVIEFITFGISDAFGSAVGCKTFDERANGKNLVHFIEQQRSDEGGTVRLARHKSFPLKAL